MNTIALQEVRGMDQSLVQRVLAMSDTEFDAFLLGAGVEWQDDTPSVTVTHEHTMGVVLGGGAVFHLPADPHAFMSDACCGLAHGDVQGVSLYLSERGFTHAWEFGEDYRLCFSCVKGASPSQIDVLAGL